jgi:NDP-sugar pyrophosphorylase family protein
MTQRIKDYELEASTTQIVLAVGGSGKRLGAEVPKSLVKVGEDTLLDRAVGFFSNCGFRNFVFLLGYKDTAITAHITKSGWKNVKTELSYDYEEGISKGKAFKQALDSGKIDRSKRSIFAFPDDLFLDSNLPMKAMMEHAYSSKAFGTIASAVVAKAHRSAFGIAQVDHKNIIQSFEEKPLIPLMATVGMYLFEPAFYRYVDELVDLKTKGPLDLETTVLPELARLSKVYAIVIPPDSWIPVNTQKELEQAQKLIDSGMLPPR